LPSVPSRITFDSPALPSLPMSMLFEPVVRLWPASEPIAMFESPVVLAWSAWKPEGDLVVAADLRDERTGALDRAGPSLPRSLRAAQGGSLQSSPVDGSQSGQLPRAALGVPLGGTQAHEVLVHGSRGERAVETDRRTGGSRANREGQRQAGNDG